MTANHTEHADTIRQFIAWMPPDTDGKDAAYAALDALVSALKAAEHERDALSTVIRTAFPVDLTADLAGTQAERTPDKADDE